MDPAVILQSLGAAIIAGGVTLYVAWRQWRKDSQQGQLDARSKTDQAEVDKVAVILESWDDFTEKITADRDRLEQRVAGAEDDLRAARLENVELRRENGDLRRDVTNLTTEVEQLRLVVEKHVPPPASPAP